MGFFVDFSIIRPRPDRLEQKLVYFKSSNFNISPDSMGNLNLPKNTLFYPCSIAIFTEISNLQQTCIFFKTKRRTSNPDTPFNLLR